MLPMRFVCRSYHQYLSTVFSFSRLSATSASLILLKKLIFISQLLFFTFYRLNSLILHLFTKNLCG